MFRQCVHFPEFMKEQVAGLKKAIDDDKWFLSEKAHKDVGFEAAKQDFLEKYFPDWAEQFRKGYCENNCRQKEECLIYQEYVRPIKTLK